MTLLVMTLLVITLLIMTLLIITTSSPAIQHASFLFTLLLLQVVIF